MRTPLVDTFHRSLLVTLGARTEDHWPVTAAFQEHPRSPAQVASGRFVLVLEELAAITDPKLYGVALGRALFTDELRDLYVRAKSGTGPLHFMLSLDAPDLRALDWERLCGPRGAGMEPVGLDQRVAYSRYIPSPTAYEHGELRASELRALVLVANPEGLQNYRLAPFDAEAAVAAVREGLPGVPITVLGPVQGAAGPSSVDAMCRLLTESYFPILHVIAHGQVSRGDDPETILYLSDDNNQAKPVPKPEFVDRLGLISDGRPDFIFFASCEAGVDPREDAMEGGGLARSLVGRLGIPAVLAMSSRVSIATALALTRSFYGRLRVHGHVDIALAEAGAELAGRRDAHVPALYSRLGALPLFTVDEAATSGPEPQWSADMKVLGVALQRALARREFLAKVGQETDGVDTEISGIRQRMRHDGLLHAGDILAGRFLLLAILGEGPSSVVWRAHDRELKRDVALKVLHSQHTRHPELVRQFRRAFERVQKLEHGVVRPLGPVQAEHGRVFVPLELTTGGTLAELVHQRRLAREGVIPIVIKLAKILGHAHEKGLLHRDVEPSNILFDAQGEPRLGDFDMLFEHEKLIDSGISHVSPGVFLAPECIAGTPKASPATDVYGLAMTALFMYTGRHPTEALHVPRRYFRRLEVPPHIRAALRRAVAFEPERRFPTMQAFAAALENPPPRLRQPLVAGAALLLLILLVFLVLLVAR